jgi:chromosome segregation ATPase
LAAKSVAAMKAELAEEKVTRAKVQAKTETVARKVEDLKKMPDRFATQISSLEEKVEHLDNKVIDVFTEATLRR